MWGIGDHADHRGDCHTDSAELVCSTVSDLNAFKFAASPGQSSLPPILQYQICPLSSEYSTNIFEEFGSYAAHLMLQNLVDEGSFTGVLQVSVLCYTGLATVN